MNSKFVSRKFIKNCLSRKKIPGIGGYSPPNYFKNDWIKSEISIKRPKKDILPVKVVINEQAVSTSGRL
jgi:hypothetical protein